jgi:hypothetical protein
VDELDHLRIEHRRRRRTVHDNDPIPARA